MTSAAQDQAVDILPPRTGLVCAVSVDATSRPYDMSTLDWYGSSPTNNRPNQEYMLSLYADGGDVHVAFGSATLTVDDTAKVSAGGTLAFTANATYVIPSSQERTFRIRRITDAWIAMKTASGTAVLRFYVSSNRVPGAA